MPTAPDDAHLERHKAVQHDYDPGLDVDEPTFVDPGEHDDVWASAVTPEEYVLSDPAVMESALRQQAILDAEAGP